jgi:23S rRNA pseudouridine1911/1915/1917 synthase
MKILFADKHIVVCQKACGELSEGYGKNCLPSLISQKLQEIGETDTNVFPVHRLDKETAGLIVYARDSRSAASLSQSIRDKSFKKEYLAILCGVPQNSSDTLCDLMFYDRNRGKAFVVDRERASVKKASLDYSVEQTLNGLSLVSVRLHTGRTHQIRVQFSSRGLPVAGDRRYGAPKQAFNGIALLSRKLSFPHPQTGENVEFLCEIPKSEPWTDFVIK